MRKRYYVRAWNSIPPTKPVHFCAWLLRVTRNLCLNRIEGKRQKKRNTEVLSLSDELAETLASPYGMERILDDRTAARVIDGYLDSCDRVSRFLFVRRNFYGDDDGELARYTGKNQSGDPHASLPDALRAARTAEEGGTERMKTVGNSSGFRLPRQIVGIADRHIEEAMTYEPVRPIRKDVLK